MYLPHEQRVVEEHHELVKKINSLDNFLREHPAVRNLSYTEISDLQDQLDVMEDYATVLERRIDRFKK